MLLWHLLFPLPMAMPWCLQKRPGGLRRRLWHSHFKYPCLVCPRFALRCEALTICVWCPYPYCMQCDSCLRFVLSTSLVGFLNRQGLAEVKSEATSGRLLLGWLQILDGWKETTRRRWVCAAHCLRPSERFFPKAFRQGTYINATGHELETLLYGLNKNPS